MTDSNVLRAWIAGRGLKLKHVAKVLGITPYSLQRKIDNLAEFKASEIAAFVTDLGMATEERDKIFFATM